ncbi:DNA helicase, partial [Tanacetum coccineum]
EQLETTPATFYYINPQTKEAADAYTMYNFKATVTDGTATTEFTFFTEAGEKITGHSCSHLREKFEATDKT